MEIRQVDLKDLLPEVEYRTSCGRYFVVFPDADLELAMSFRSGITAGEIALQAFRGMPFFDHIPCVKRGTEYPRSWITYPDGMDKDRGFVQSIV